MIVYMKSNDYICFCYKNCIKRGFYFVIFKTCNSNINVKENPLYRTSFNYIK